jgi:hypothetical protein
MQCKGPVNKLVGCVCTYVLMLIKRCGAPAMSQFHEQGRAMFFFSLQLHRVLNSVTERVFREADRGAGQRAGHRLAIEVVKLLVKPLVKLYQTG